MWNNVVLKTIGGNGKANPDRIRSYDMWQAMFFGKCIDVDCALPHVWIG